MSNENQHIPSGYKPSPLGIIPEDWDVKRLGEITTKIGSGITPRGGQNVYVTNGHPFIRSQNVGNGHLLLDDIVYIDESTHQKQISTIIARHDVLLNITGASIGRCTVAEESIVGGNVNQHVCIIRLKNKDLSNFVCSFLLSYLGQKQVDSFQAGGNREGLNYDQISSFKICVPPLNEIYQITTILSLWDIAIAKQTTLIEKLILHKRGLMQQLLTGKKRLKGVEGEWKKRTYSSILKEIKRSLVWDEDELYKLISVRRRSEGLFFRESLYGREIATKNLRPAKAGDFLISKMQIVHGASGLVTEEFDNAKISGSYIALVAKDDKVLDIEYFNLWSQTPRFYHQTFISSFGVHIEKMTFDLNTFMSFGMLLPPIEEQHAIVSTMNYINEEIEIQKQKLATLQEQKKGLMQVLLTGKKRIK